MGYAAMSAFSFAARRNAPLLDMLPVAPLAAYGLRRLRSAYAGACLRVRRSSDSAEQDIGFAGVGLDAPALLSFVGANNGHVVTWLDQSGNARNMLQATASAQPRIVTSGVYLGHVLTDSAFLHRMVATDAAFGLHASPATICAALGSVSDQNNAFLNLIWGLGTVSGARVWFGSNPASRDITVRPSATNQTASPTLTMGATGSVIGFTKTAAANLSGAKARLNNGAPSTFAAEALAAFDNTFSINNSTNFGVSSTVGHEEYLVFGAELSEAELSLIARSQGAYYGVSVS